MQKTLLTIVLATLCLFFEAEAQNITKLTGRITTAADGKPLPGASITIKASGNSTQTDTNGQFTINTTAASGTLIVSYTGYNTEEVSFNTTQSTTINASLKEKQGDLEEVVVIGYGQTTKRLNTGSVSSISAKEIENQPVTNVLSALSGRMPGVFVQTTNGLPGGNINIQIRGQGSIAAGTAPLYIIDGIPFNTTVGNLTASSVLSSAANGVISPLNSLNPNDIENISVLKDADATAIYGSRGSNGVVLITTKKGLEGKTRVDISVSQALNRVSTYPNLLNPEQYLQIRREAFNNSNQTPSSDPQSPAYAPELTIWETNNPTNWPVYFLGRSGNITNAMATVDGGGANTSFSLSGNYRAEKTYLRGDNQYQRGNLRSYLQHRSTDQKFTIQLSTIFNLDNNKLANPGSNLSFNLLLPPNYPIYNADGSYNWYAGSNAAAELNAYSKSRTDNLLTNLKLDYKFSNSIMLNISGGYNQINYRQRQVFPTEALYPGTINYTNFGNNGNRSFIIEPQLNFDKKIRSGRLSALLGATYQNRNSQGEYIKGSNFNSVSLMENFASAATYQLSNNFTVYKYSSLFGRITYNLNERYVLNLSMRRDASSKFGPGNKMGNFGAAGLAWLFDQEKLVKEALPFLSYGKLRVSYGITGNDQITDYQYLSTYGNSTYQYQDIQGLTPSRISNSDYHWESTRKAEFSLALGFVENRLLLNINRYINTSSDQLILYTVPTITGFTNYQANLPAEVQNSGWEFEIQSKNIIRKGFSWSTNFNFTLPKNRLLSFKDLATSSYSRTLVIGEDINRVYGYLFTGLNETGLPLYQTISGTPSLTPSSATDAYFTIGKETADFYGGLGNSITIGRLGFDVFGQFAKQKSLGSLVYSPGSQLYNSYSVYLNRWTPENTHTQIPKASTANNSRYGQSSGNYFDSSYFRIKTVSISYALPKFRVFIQTQNLYTFWNRNSAILDPESGAIGAAIRNLPPTQTISIGINTSL